MTTSNLVFSAFSLVSFILVSIPFPWHWKSRNSATCLYILWVSSSNLVYFIDSVLWNGNVVDRSSVWCDIGKFIWRQVPNCIVIFHRGPRNSCILCSDPWSVSMYPAPHISRPLRCNGDRHSSTSGHLGIFVALMF
jgi:Pheromone A receptor